MIGIVIDSVKVSPETGLHVVTLREQQGKRSLHIFVESDEANAIAAALDNRVDFQPSTFELLSLVIKRLSARVSMILVSDCKRLKDKVSLTFNAKILVVDGVKEFTIVAHAPDAIAIAILTQAPVFVQESVMDTSYRDTLTQARMNELSWLDVKDLSEAKELPSSREELNRMLLPEEINTTAEKVELLVHEVRHGMMCYMHAVVLTDKQRNRYLTIFTGTTEAHTIDNLVHNIASSNSHQLLCRIVEGCSSRVNMGFIVDSSDRGYRAQLIFGSGDRQFGVECRPSDVIITTLIANAPIYATKSLLDTEVTPPAQLFIDKWQQNAR